MSSIEKQTVCTHSFIIKFFGADLRGKTLLYSLLFAIISLCLTPSPGISRGEPPRSKDQKPLKEESFEKAIWNEAMAQDPDKWSDELKNNLLRLKPDSTIEELAEGIRTRQLHAKIHESVKKGEMSREEAKKQLDRLSPPTKRPNNTDKNYEIEKFRNGVLARAKMQIPADWSDELKAAIVRAGWDVEEIAKKFHGNKSKINDEKLEREKKQKYRKGVLTRAAAQSPDEWSDELMDAIKKAGWSVKELAAKISKHQEETRGGIRSKSTNLSLLMLELDTAVENHSWGQIKKEIAP